MAQSSPGASYKLQDNDQRQLEVGAGWRRRFVEFFLKHWERFETDSVWPYIWNTAAADISRSTLQLWPAKHKHFQPLIPWSQRSQPAFSSRFYWRHSTESSDGSSGVAIEWQRDAFIDRRIFKCESWGFEQKWKFGRQACAVTSCPFTRWRAINLMSF